MVAAYDPGEADEVVQGSEGLDYGCDGFGDCFVVCDVYCDTEDPGLGEL